VRFSGFILGFLLVPGAIAQPFFVQQGDKLVDPSASQGGSVALSADGNTAVVSAGFLTVPGAIAYSRLNGVWTEQAQLMETGFVDAYPAKNLHGAGQTIAISSDGNTLVLGRPDDNDSVGAVFMFTRSGSSWRQTAKLIGTGTAGVARQGYSVAISGDGRTVMVGGPYDAGGAGAAWVFARSSNNWSQQGPKLVGSGDLLQIGKRKSGVRWRSSDDSGITQRYRKVCG
jgi:FG-GAP repeat